MQKIKTKPQQSIDSVSDDEMSNQGQLDLTVLRKPIITSVTGFEEVLKAYEEGTNEVK